MSLLDYTTSNTTNATQQLGSTTMAGNTNQLGFNNSANQYNSTQLGLQGLAGNYMRNLLVTGQPGPFQPNEGMATYANYLFNKNVAPRIAASHGSNSPALWGAQQELNLGLAAQGQQQAFQQGLSAYQMASDYAYRPIGVNSSASSNTNQSQNTIQQQNSNQQQQTKQTTVDGGGLLDFGASTLQGLAGYFLR